MTRSQIRAPGRFANRPDSEGLTVNDRVNRVSPG
jgi:hypothetical protein